MASEKQRKYQRIQKLQLKEQPLPLGLSCCPTEESPPAELIHSHWRVSSCASLVGREVAEVLHQQNLLESCPLRSWRKLPTRLSFISGSVSKPPEGVPGKAALMLPELDTGEVASKVRPWRSHVCYRSLERGVHWVR